MHYLKIYFVFSLFVFVNLPRIPFRKIGNKVGVAEY